MIQEQLRDLVTAALGQMLTTTEPSAVGDVSVQIETPNNPEHGDFCTNIALVLAGVLDQRPRQLAERIVAGLPAAEVVDRVEVAGAGFINFYLSPTWLHNALRQSLTEKEHYGCSDLGAGQKVQVEFVSANPVGPIHIGNARGGPYGDVLANLLAAIGCEVQREYYVNDGPENTQLKLFGASVQARYLQEFGIPAEVPQDGYEADYVVELARRLKKQDDDAHADVATDESGALHFFSLVEEWMVEGLEEDCAAMGIEFDRWFRESELYEQDLVRQQVNKLLEGGTAYEKDGAVWLRTGDFGDEEDRVLVRATGSPTYLASDLAYAVDKFVTRGFDKVIYVWGPDHAGYVARLQAALAAIGVEAKQAEIIIYQTVRLLADGEALRLSKRRGNIITIREIIDDIGRDAVRFFFLMRSVDAHLDFDLDLARQQSEENPVYYVQYAHARICSILRETAERGVEILPLAQVDLSLLIHPDELALLRKIADYPELIQQAAVDRAPHRLPHFARDLAQTFHQFYSTCRVLDADQPTLSQARLKVVEGTQIVLQNLLALLGITAPEQM